jgi:hypothetical protein
MWPSVHDVLALDDHTSCTLQTEPTFRGTLAATFGAEHLAQEVTLLLVRDLPALDLEARRVASGAQSDSHMIAIVSKGKARSKAARQVGYRESASVDAPLRHFLFARRPGIALAPLVLLARQAKPWPLSEACALVAQLAGALPHAERAHLDPCTAGRDARGLWVLHPTLDGFLRAVRREAREPVKWLGYQAPETLRGAHQGEASAVFGLGVLLHELLAGRALFDRPNALMTLRALAHDTPAPLAWLVPGTPLPVAACAQAMLDRDPLRRPQLAAVTRELAPFASTSEEWKARAVAGSSDAAPFLARL